MHRFYAVLPWFALALLPIGAAQAQTLNVTPNPLTLSAQLGGSSVTATLNFTSSDGVTPINFTAVSNTPWLSVAVPPSGQWTTPQTVTVTINPSNCAANTAPPACLTLGQNNGYINVTGAQNPVVSVNVNASNLTVSSTSVNLGTYQAGSTIYPSPQSISVSGVNGQTASFTVSTAPGDTWYTAAKSSNSVLIQFNSQAAATLQPNSTPLQGTLTITPAGSNAIPIQVLIFLTVTNSPQITVSPATGLTFNWELGGGNNQYRQFLTLSSDAAVPISIAASVPQGIGWLSIPSTNVTIPAGGSVQFEVDVNASNQSPLPTSSSIQIAIPSGALFTNGTTQFNVPVALNVASLPVLYSSPAVLSYSYQFGSGNNPTAVSVNVTSSNLPTQTMQFNVVVSSINTPWLSVSSTATLTTPNSVQVMVNAVGLTPNIYNGSISITPVANGSNQTSITIPVTLNVSFSPVLQVSTNQLVFPYQIGQATPQPQTITLSTSTGAPLVYQVIPPNVSWLQVTGPLNGTTDQTPISVSIIPSGVPVPVQAGPLDVSISITAKDPNTGVVVPSQSIDVKLYADTNPVLVVYPPGPLQFVTYPNAPGYPVASTCGSTLTPCIVSLSSSSSAPGGTISIAGVQDSVIYQAQTGNWLNIGNPPGSTTPTVFSVTATQATNGSMLPGTYSGKVSIIANGAAGPVSDGVYAVPVNFVVASANGSVQTGQADGSIRFSQTQGGPVPATQSVVVNTDSGAFPFAVVANTGLADWLTVTAISGSTPGSFTVSANGSNLTPGTYNGAVYVTIPNVAGSPFRVPVTLTVGGSIQTSLPSLLFTQVIGGPVVSPQTITVTSQPSALSFAVSTTLTTAASSNWLSANVASGGSLTPGNVSVSVAPGNLGLGSYTGTVAITSPTATDGPLSIPVTLNVVQATISAPSTQLNFTQLTGGPAPASQSVTVQSSPGPVGITVSAVTTSGGNWLSASIPASSNGVAPAIVQVSVNGASLTPGQYSGSVSITSPSANGSPITILVGLTVQTGGVLQATPGSVNLTSVVGQGPQQQNVTLTSSIGGTFTVTAATQTGGNWLTASPLSGTWATTPTLLTVSANPQNLAVGTYNGTVTITSANSVAPVTIQVSLTVQPIPTPVVIAVVNAASYEPGAVSPGENVVIGGTGIGPAQIAGAQLTASGSLSTNVGNTQVLFDGVPAPIMYASATQTSVMVPYGIAGRPTTSIQVVYEGVASAPLSYTVAAAVPGIYTQNQQGFGPGVILDSDNVTVNGLSTPAAAGSAIVVYLTGEGATSPASATGAVAGTSGNGLNKPILGVTATIGGQPASLLYWGSAPDIVYGIMQANIVIPPGTPSGPQPLVITIGNTPTQSGVTVQVK